jgi:hypothetical protein
MENHHFSWEIPLFLWPFSIAMLVHQRVSQMDGVFNMENPIEMDDEMGYPVMT